MVQPSHERLSCSGRTFPHDSQALFVLVPRTEVGKESDDSLSSLFSKF